MISGFLSVSAREQVQQRFSASRRTRSRMSTGFERARNLHQIESSGALPLLNDTVLGMIRVQAQLPKILEVLCTQIEKQHPDLLCSILLLDADGTTLRRGAAPSLPREYSRAVDGVQIGPCAGSCGTAVYR